MGKTLEGYFGIIFYFLAATCLTDFTPDVSDRGQLYKSARANQTLKILAVCLISGGVSRPGETRPRHKTPPNGRLSSAAREVFQPQAGNF